MTRLAFLMEHNPNARALAWLLACGGLSGLMATSVVAAVIVMMVALAGLVTRALGRDRA